MRLPSLLRSAETFAPLPHLSDDDLQGMLTRQLRTAGAARVLTTPDTISFDATGMGFNVSPLATCDTGEFAIRREAGRTRVEYSLGMDVLTTGGAFVLCAIVALSLCMVSYGRFAPAVIGGFFYAGGLAGSYLFFSNRMRAVVRTAMAAASGSSRVAGFGYALGAARPAG